MPEIRGFDKVMKVLIDYRAKSMVDGNVTAVVGYTASYAIYVHENLTAHHKPGKQAKFLEAPARQLHDQIAAIVAQELKRGKSMGQAMLKAGLFLQAASQRLCPVDTGNLRASAFTRLE